jgi:choice-of-anchor B domain-containing protein
MIDISNPASPEFAGCFAEHEYIHDTQCVVYSGPDADHRGSEICFNSAATTSAPGGIHTLSIVDVSDKANPVALAREDYPNPGYSHQGWLTPDSRFFLHGDELDEVNHGIGTTTRVWNVTDLDNPVLETAFENETTSIDHNIYTEGKLSYHSNYTSGLRIYDNKKLPALSEKSFFDIYPENDNASFEGGTWSNYPYFARKRVVAVSSIDRGLFILRGST